MSTNDDVLRFSSESPEADQANLQLRGFRGREVVSQLFRYELDLETDQEGGLNASAIDDLLNRRCSISFGRGGASVMYGRLCSIELMSTFDEHTTHYRAEMVPRLFEASLYRRSRVFQHLTWLGIVERILVEHGLEADVDYTLRAMESNYAIREYTVQYQETDLDFICRLLEHEGIFFFYQHGPSGDYERAEQDHLVIGDTNQHFTPHALGEDSFAYDARSVLIGDRPGVLELGCTTQLRPSRVQLVEYNWRRPTMLSSEAACDEATGGESFHHSYGDHFKNQGEGDQLAQIRAEEILASRVVYRGRARAVDLTAGHRFELVGHSKPELDQQYIVTEIEQNVSISEGDETRHEKRFTAISFDTRYRPPRLTPRPRIEGYVHGVIDSQDVQQDTVAPVDHLGQYTVVQPYDLYGAPGGPLSTRRIRMAQPASGNTNIHFPLDVGAEVAIVHLGGDPDRPLIVGSPPHGQARVSVDVGGEKDNRTQSLIESRGGVFIEIEDDW